MSLELKKKQLEHARVKLAREELELKIEERLDEIKRLEAAIEIQVSKEAELLQDIKTLSNK